MATKKALPDDVNKFFEGDSVFFTEKQESKKPEKKREVIKTERVNGRTEQQPERSGEATEPVQVVDETEDDIVKALKEGRREDTERTERYSFEIYPSQKEDIEDFLYQYKKKTGERLSASKLIREAIQQYLDKLSDQL